MNLRIHPGSDGGMTPSEVEIYTRAREIWLSAGAKHRRDPYIRPTFGAHIESYQLLGTRIAAFIRRVWMELRG